jgi:prevent-host-death family protein
MITVTQTEFRNHIKKYMDAVERGEEIEIYRNGKPVAAVSPIQRQKVPSWKRDRPLLKLPDGVSASRLIIEERDEGW